MKMLMICLACMVAGVFAVLNGSGTSVVISDLDRIHSKCFFPDDHSFMRRLAWILTRDGSSSNLQEKGNIYKITGLALSLTNSFDLEFTAKVNAAFGIVYNDYGPEDLRDTFVSALVMRMLLNILLPNADLSDENVQKDFVKAFFPNNPPYLDSLASMPNYVEKKFCPSQVTETPTITYNCGSNSPCNPLVTADNYYYPHDDASKYVQCDAHGGCFNMPCSSGLVWDNAIRSCDWP